jgi:hypothetical protein
VNNEKVLHRVKNETNSLYTTKKEGYVDWPHIVQELPSKTLLKETE